MMQHYAIHIIGALITLAGTAYLWHQRSNRPEGFIDMVNPDNFLLMLKRLSYFKYTDSENIPGIEFVLRASLTNDNKLSTVCDGISLVPLDYRIYSFNGEGVLEKGGIAVYLKSLPANTTSFTAYLHDQ